MSDSERSAAIIRRAIEIMAAGAYGWSWALKQAQKEINSNEK